MTFDRLDWTGNHFIKPEYISHILRKLSESTWNPTIRKKAYLDDMKTAISTFYNLDKDCLCLAAGSAVGIDCFLRSCREKNVVEIAPNFHQTYTVAMRDGRPYDGIYSLDRSDILEELKYYSNSNAILSFSSPNNPFGHQMRIERLMSILEMWTGPVLLDEAYVEYADYSAISLISRYPNLVVSRTFSKAWGLADLRIGFIAGQRLRGLDSYFECVQPSQLSAYVATHLLEQPSTIEESIIEAKRMRDRMVSKLEETAFFRVPATKSNFVCVIVDRPDACIRRLGEAGITVKKLSRLRYWPDHWPDGFRMSVCRQEVFERVMAAVMPS